MKHTATLQIQTLAHLASVIVVGNGMGNQFCILVFCMHTYLKCVIRWHTHTHTHDWIIWLYTASVDTIMWPLLLLVHFQTSIHSHITACDEHAHTNNERIFGVSMFRIYLAFYNTGEPISLAMTKDCWKYLYSDCNNRFWTVFLNCLQPQLWHCLPRKAE